MNEKQMPFYSLSQPSLQPQEDSANSSHTALQVILQPAHALAEKGSLQ